MPKEKLAEYKRKRDPKKTPEPAVEPPVRGSGRGEGVRGNREVPPGQKKSTRRKKTPIFVIQRHAARSLHYDFRLERNGALASWAVPKGPPLEPGQQHLAVHVEDHPLEYATFEGEIPKGEYGGGTVEIWDKGTYELLEEKKNGGLTVRLHGERLNGTYALVPAKLSGDPKNWLILRKKDDTAPAARAPRSYRPMLATPAKEVPKGDWIYEIKWDGYRIVATVAGGNPELRTRKDQDYTKRFEKVAAELVKALKTPDCVVDGEVCALDEEGRPSFSAMQQGNPGTPIVYFVFDLLEVEGEPLIDLPLEERRKRLEKLLDKRNRTVRYSETFDDGDALFEAANQQGLEGIMAKRLGSKYLPGRRSREWLKVKGHGRQEFVVAGYTRGQGRRQGTLGSLVLATYEGGDLDYVGNVGTGFSDREIDRLLSKLKPLERDTPPFKDVPKMPRVKKGDVVWVEPRLVAEVEFVEWTHDGHLRAPAYKGLREDKEATEVRREEPEPFPAEIRKGKRVFKPSNVDKLFWADEGITKGDLLSYYHRVARVLVPHLKDRPFTLKRYPDGWQGKFFFQKDAPKGMPDWIPKASIVVTTRDKPRQRRRIEAPLVNDELALLWMVNMGCIDLNAWYSRIDKPERPDFVLFDLDPSPDVGFAETIEVALLVKQALETLELESVVKTSGSEGIHILVPVARRHTYADTREFSAVIANALARTHRGLVTTEWTRSKRRGVLIDSNQNGEGKTIASVYSVRPKAGAPVSTPLRWDEVNESLDPAAFTMEEVLRRIEKHGDLFADVLTTKQSLTAALKTLR
jgi:bifunctional non-homologous end joining protein LigD